MRAAPKTAMPRPPSSGRKRSISADKQLHSSFGLSKSPGSVSPSLGLGNASTQYASVQFWPRVHKPVSSFRPWGSPKSQRFFHRLCFGILHRNDLSAVHRRAPKNGGDDRKLEDESPIGAIYKSLAHGMPTLAESWREQVQTRWVVRSRRPTAPGFAPPGGGRRAMRSQS